MSAPTEDPRDGLLKSIVRDIDFTPFSSLFVGFSGGSDSLAALLLMARLAERLPCALTAVHFEHGLRGKAGRDDARWVKKFCASRQIPCLVEPLRVMENRAPGEGVEEAARRLRALAWKRLADRPHAAVVLGHHADDVIENLLLRLARGSGASGLTGLRKIAILNGVTYLRPLLSMGREDLRSFLRSLGLSHWRHDETNDDATACRRNFIRDEWLPKLYDRVPDARAGLLMAERALRHDAEFIEAAAETFLKTQTGDKLPLTDLRSAHPALLPRIFRRWLSERLHETFLPDAAFIERLRDALSRENAHSLRLPLGPRRFLLIERGHVRVQNAEHSPATVLWNWRETPVLAWENGALRVTAYTPSETNDWKTADASLAYFDTAALPNILTVRPWRAGDRMVPFKSVTPKSLKKIFGDQKISASEKRFFPLLCLPDDKTILWVAGVRRSNIGEIDNATHSITRFEFSPNALSPTCE